MKLTNDEIYVLFSALQELKKNKVTLPIKDGFNLVKNIQILQPLVEAIETTKQDIISKFLNENGEVPKDQLPQINAQLFELSKIENEISLHVLPLTKIEGLELNLDAVSALMPIIEDGE